ncbi:ATP-binding cassette domain-containing protein [Leucobacter allii]|uniref:ATP-binding cassette domain-containing protein n=1 Tax=Leucobacter allii TaxID=2932247 RepID=A0ABY4FR13_9MICO|nr:ATP-binding cassette domain-containing protein [Leucobacter allii]UOQ58729.1 ATP-binding cassette domain-containing protein [Leucobacter allii]
MSAASPGGAAGFAVTAGSAGAAAAAGEANAASPGGAAARRAVLARALPSRARRAPGTILGICADACVIGLLGLSMWLIVRAGEQPPILHLTFAIVGVRALAIGRAAFRYAERLSSHDAALAHLAELRARTFDALVPRVPGAIESHRRGDVLAAFVDDVDQLQDEPLRVRQPLIVSGSVCLLSLVVIALLAPAAALILVGALLVAGAAAVLLARRHAAASDRALGEARAALLDALLERLASAEALAAFDALPAQRERIRAAEARLSAVQMRRARSAGLTAAILSAGAGAASLLTLLLLAPALGGGLSGPLFAALVVVPAAVFEIFAQVPAALVARRAVAASAERIAALTETPLPPEIPVETPHAEASAGASARSGASARAGASVRADAPARAGASARADASARAGASARADASARAGASARADASARAGGADQATATVSGARAASETEDATGTGGANGAGARDGGGAPLALDPSLPAIEVDALALRHPGSAQDAVSGLSFRVPVGGTLVVTGDSGAGKSTLALALVRFLEYRGSYRVGGVEARSLPIARLRATVGLCEQTSQLFDADLRQNLRFARESASDAELLAVLERVGLREWALTRGGLDAPVGEEGALVSGGQAQRIALARAILADFPIVVLDEPTAGVDRELADGLLRDLLNAVPEDRAVILITHTELPAGIRAERLAL